MKPSKTAMILATITASFVSMAIALFWYADVRYIEPHMAPAPEPVPRQYVGNAALYRYMASEDGPIPPHFSTKALLQDRKHLKGHIRNTAAKRHWLRFKVSGQYDTIGYVLPDYDIDIIRQITRAPYDWAQETQRHSQVYAPQPNPDDMMKITLHIGRHQPHEGFLAGGIMAGAIAVILLIITGSVYTADIARNFRFQSSPGG